VPELTPEGPDINMKSMRGQRGLVIGGGRGIGRACVLGLTERGARCALAYLSDGGAAEATAGRAAALGERPVVVQGDVGRDAEQLVGEASVALGGLDFLVSTAAPEILGSMQDVTYDGFHRSMEVVAWGFQRASIAAGAAFGERGGSVVAISSLGSKDYAKFYGALGPAKAALETIVRYLAVELGPACIRVNAVSPCLVDDGKIATGASDLARFRDLAARRTPLRRLPTPEDVANVVATLVSDDCRMITGQVVVVDGGYSVVG
jgi:NAD(P)-dependent dehydrogenase (short-subunit alcohol dehydrogenase family)